MTIEFISKVRHQVSLLSLLIILSSLAVFLYWQSANQSIEVPLVSTPVHESPIQNSSAYQADDRIEEATLESSVNNHSQDNPYPVSLMGPRGIVNLRVMFDKHYQLALEGDPESMYVISQVTQNCAIVMPYKSLEEFEKSDWARAPGMASYLPTVRRLFPDCVYINSHRQGDIESIDDWRKNVTSWHGQWLTKAARAGYVLARLESMKMSGEGHEAEYVTLLDKAVRQKHPNAMEDAAVFIQNIYRKPRREQSLGLPEKDPRNLIYEFWGYMECKYHNECDMSVLLQNLEARYYPRDIESIKAAAIRFEQRILDPTPIDFELIANQHIDEVFVNE